MSWTPEVRSVHRWIWTFHPVHFHHVSLPSINCCGNSTRVLQPEVPSAHGPIIRSRSATYPPGDRPRIGVTGIGSRARCPTHHPRHFNPEPPSPLRPTGRPQRNVPLDNATPAHTHTHRILQIRVRVRERNQDRRQKFGARGGESLVGPRQAYRPTKNGEEKGLFPILSCPFFAHRTPRFGFTRWV